MTKTADTPPEAEAALERRPFDSHRTAWSRSFRLFFSNDGFAAAGNLAFLTMLSLFPFIIFLISLSGFFGQTDRGLEAVTFLLSELPPRVASVLDGPIQGVINNTGAEILTGSILFALWTSANGVEAARSVFTKAFGRETAIAVWRSRLESIAIVVLGAVFILLAMSFLVLSAPIIKAITSAFPDSISVEFSRLLKFTATFVSPTLIALGLYFVFIALTPRRIAKPYFWPGCLLALLFFVGTAKGFSIYLRYADQYDVTYGSLAGVMVTQLFCFFVSLGFVLGVELNAAYTLERDTRRKTEN